MATATLPASTLARIHAPTLAHVRSRLDSLLADAERRAGVAQIAEVDGAVSGAVLRGVHCPLYAYEDTSGGAMVRRAVERTSVATLRRVTRSLPLYSRGGDREHVEAACRRWVHAVAVAAAARALANDGGFDDPGAAFLAGLMHDLGWRFAAAHGDSPEKATDRLLRCYGLSDEVISAVRFNGAVRRGMPAESIAIAGRPLPDRTRRLLILLAHADELATEIGYGDGTTTSVVGSTASDVPESLATAHVRESIELELRHAAALLELEDAEPQDIVRRLTNAEMRALENLDDGPAISTLR